MSRLRWLVLLLVLFTSGLIVGRASVPQEATPPPSWSIAGSLAEARNYPQVTALPTGELLVTGGVDPAFPDVARATSELFDVVRGSVDAARAHPVPHDPAARRARARARRPRGARRAVAHVGDLRPAHRFVERGTAAPVRARPLGARGPAER